MERRRTGEGTHFVEDRRSAIQRRISRSCPKCSEVSSSKRPRPKVCVQGESTPSKTARGAGTFDPCGLGWLQNAAARFGVLGAGESFRAFEAF